MERAPRKSVPKKILSKRRGMTMPRSESTKEGNVSFFDIFVLVLMVIFLFVYIRNQYGEVEFVRSNVDGRRYLVRKLRDSQQAADMLGELNKRLCALIKHLRAKYPDHPGIKRLQDNFYPDNVSEGGIEHGYTSYSVNKSEKIVMCIRQDDDSFVSMNTLMYVATHELAHLMTKGVGHTDNFWANFEFMIKEAVDIGLYDVVDYSQHPVEYCGIKITSSILTKE